jgi:hypothetical protein
MTNPNGYIIWEGVSPLDGAPIVLIATGFADASANDKTGSMLQTWILRTDIEPHTAYKNGEGASVCGSCPHFVNKTCYVTWYQAPLSVYRAYKRGSYAKLPSYELFRDHAVRIGSAGDPFCVPESVWRQILAVSGEHTGYTHQWRQPAAQPYRDFLQASCDGIADYLEATAHGWHTYLVTPAGTPDPAGTVHCAASSERGSKTNCKTCHLCDGSSANVVIHAHGSRASRVTLSN